MASRFLVAGGTGNWNSNTNWASVSGGASGASFPVNGDTVTFDTNSGNANLTINVASACTSIAISNYTGTLTFTNNLTVAGSVTLGSGMAFSGTGALICSETGTLTSNGVTASMPVRLTPATAPGCTYTLADDWTCTSTVTVGSAVSTTGCVINGNKFNCTNLTSSAASSRNVQGTTEFVMNATGTLDGTTDFRNNLTINTSGTITMGSLVYGGNTFQRTSGTVNVTAGTKLTVTSLNTTFDLSSVTLANVGTIGGSSPVYTLVSDLTVSGTYNTSAAAPNWNTSTGKKLFLASLTAGASCILQGTATVEFYTTGTWQSGGANAQVKSNVVFNAGAGTTTISGNIYYSTGTMTYTSGTIITTSSTLNMSASATLNTSGITWNDIIITSSNPTITLNSLLLATGTLTTSGVSGTLTFAGTSGFTVATWVDNTGGMTIKLGSTLTYNVTSSLTLMGTAASRITLNASSGGSQAILTLDNGATQSIGYVSATDINSGLGQIIWDYKPVLSNTINWNTLGPTLLTISNVSMS